VAKGAPEQISFTSTPPSDATVGASYSPIARSSLGWPLVFSTTTPSVCKIVLGSSRSLTMTINGVRLPPSAVDFVGPGTCTINLKPEEALGAGLEAEQCFAVTTPGASTLAPAGAPSSLELIVSPRIDHKGAATTLLKETVMIAKSVRSAKASLRRGGRLYATGRLTPSHGSLRLVLELHRHERLPAGTYTLTLSWKAGKTTHTSRQRITIE
jgi:hypothetical protein